MLETAAVFAGDAHGIVRNAAHEVGRAIQRVDDPQVIGAVTAAFEQSTFLAKDAVIRIGLAQRCNDALLGRLVDLGDVILASFSLTEIASVRSVERTISSPALRAARSAIFSMGCMDHHWSLRKREILSGKLGRM